MPVPISNVTRRQVYAPSGAGGIGPYAFTFEILANTDIAVFKDDVLLTLTTHYTVIINANGTGSVTITSAGLALAPVSPTQYAVVGNRTISRSTDFTTGGDFFANTLNDELDQQTIFAQQNAEGVARALQAPQTDPTTINMILPRSSVRANKTLAFDANGDPTTGEVIGDNRGNWAAGIAYNKRDIVKDTSNGNVYYANTSHTSSGSQPISTNADSAKWDLIVDNASATSSATAAAASASAAATSASNASTSASGAAGSASTATTQASNASTSATTATNAATAASSSASTASTAATNAANSNTAAATSATNSANSATSASGSASTATTQATNASTSATNAAGSASTATTQASNASTSASGASTSASNASTSAGNASTSATAAAASAASAAASFDAFDDIYLGAKSSDPALDNDGNALTTGDQYFNTTANELRVFNGTTFQAASTVGGTVNSLAVTGTLSVAGNNISAVNSMGFRNRIINGGCAVSQYGSVSILANTNKTYGGCDRIGLVATGFSTISGTLIQAGSAGSGASATGFVQQFGPVTTTGSGTITFIQRIEAVNVGDLNSSAVTISLSLFQDTGLTLSPTINLYKPTALDNYTSTTFINGVTVSLPSGVRTTFTFTATLGASDATNGLQLQINIPVGAVTSNNFQIGNIQLEAGSVASPFERRDIGRELMMCQRYYQQAMTGFAITNPGTETNVSCALPLKVDMRSDPSASIPASMTFHRPGVAFYNVTAINAVSNKSGQSYYDLTIAAGAGTSTAGQIVAGPFLKAEL